MTYTFESWRAITVVSIALVATSAQAQCFISSVKKEAGSVYVGFADLGPQGIIGTMVRGGNSEGKPSYLKVVHGKVTMDGSSDEKSSLELSDDVTVSMSSGHSSCVLTKAVHGTTVGVAIDFSDGWGSARTTGKTFWPAH